MTINNNNNKMKNKKKEYSIILQEYTTTRVILCEKDYYGLPLEKYETHDWINTFVNGELEIKVDKSELSNLKSFMENNVGNKGGKDCFRGFNEGFNKDEDWEKVSDYVEEMN